MLTGSSLLGVKIFVRRENMINILNLMKASTFLEKGQPHDHFYVC